MTTRTRTVSLDEVVQLLIRVLTIAMGGMAAIAISNPATAGLSVLMLAGVAVVVLIVARTRANGPWLYLGEALAAGAVIGFGPAQTDVLLPYLVAPATSAGLQFGVGWAVAATAGGGIALIGTSGARETATTAQWLLIVLVSGLLASWVRHSRLTATPMSEQQAYEEAADLLAELRTLTRPLSGGLDPRPLGAGVLAEARELVSTDAATVLLAVGSDVRPVATLEHAASLSLPTSRPGPRTVEVSDGTVTVPAKVGDRPVGWLILDTDKVPTGDTLDRLSRLAGKWALRLDAAALFEEVREVATRAERARLARDIHDGIAQDIASLGLLADDLLVDSAVERRDDMLLLRERIGSLVDELRLSIHDLRDDGVSTGGLSAAVAEAARREAAAGGMAVHLRVADAPTNLDATVETELYRIAQEALINARRHSHAQNLWVSCHSGPGGIVLVVEDDGVGPQQGRSDSVGQVIMAERAARIGAALAIASREGGGTRVHLELEADRLQLGGTATP